MVNPAGNMQKDYEFLLELFDKMINKLQVSLCVISVTSFHEVFVLVHHSFD